ncbi:hypothetical protein BK126_04570 [Paenibacillus sp. FSL H7-0326]|nr:hypothetical protein BK126_04570 [Paenibacillus sp. FSL H7-0326]
MDVKIHIPEIPAEWTQRTRSGHTNVWNGHFYRNGLPEVKLDPPQHGLYAERFDDGWYWVCDCPKCLGKDDPFPYIVCDEHNRCETCGIHRSELKEKPAWGVHGGWQCNFCHTREHEARKNAAIEAAREQGHSENDCWYTDKLICPVCASECTSDDIDPEDQDVTCYVCDTNFTVEIEYDLANLGLINSEEEED